MKSPQLIIKRPLLTEKSTRLRETGGQAFTPGEDEAADFGKQILFEVARDANKIEIRKAVEGMFKVSVLDVRTMIRKGKTKMRRRPTGRVPRTPDRKRAFVRLAEGQVIDLF